MSIHPEYMIRVKLPNSSSYHSSPSGDTEFEIAYDTAIKGALPPGFHVKKQKFNEKWAVDSEGRSIVLIEPSTSDLQDTLAWYIEEVKRLETKLEKIRNAVS